MPKLFYKNIGKKSQKLFFQQKLIFYKKYKYYYFVPTLAMPSFSKLSVAVLAAVTVGPCLVPIGIVGMVGLRVIRGFGSEKTSKAYYNKHKKMSNALVVCRMMATAPVVIGLMAK